MRVPQKPTEPVFLATNTSFERDVSLADLRITIRRGRTVNLLDKKHYHFTLDQLRTSKESGSLKAKSHLIKVNEKAGVFKTIRTVQSIERRRPLQPIRNAVKLEDPKYADLDFVEESNSEIAEESAKASVIDNRPLLAVDKKYFENGSYDSEDEED